LRVTVDDRDIRGGEKNWQWIKKGIPLRVEVGPRDVASGNIVLYRRDKEPKDKLIIDRTQFLSQAADILQEIQDTYRSQAFDILKSRTESSVATFKDFQHYFEAGKEEAENDIGLAGTANASSSSGFIVAPWSEAAETEELLAPLKVSVRCIPIEGDTFYKDGELGSCVLTGRPARVRAIFARAY
jgi:prolyl-tRNA synthetase